MCEGENNLDALRWIYILGRNDFPASYMAIGRFVRYDLCLVWFFSFPPPFKTQGCPCETVPSPWEPSEQDQRLPKDAAAGSGIPRPSHWPHAAANISFPTPAELR